MRSELARLSVIAAATVFFLMSTATATLANGPGITAPLLPFSIDVGSSVSTPHQSVVVPAAVRPALPADSGEGRRIVYAVRAQRIWLVEADATVLDSYLVSGRKNTPRPGTYKVFSKSLHARATHDALHGALHACFVWSADWLPRPSPLFERKTNANVAAARHLSEWWLRSPGPRPRHPTVRVGPHRHEGRRPPLARASP